MYIHEVDDQSDKNSGHSSNNFKLNSIDGLSTIEQQAPCSLDHQSNFNRTEFKFKERKLTKDNEKRIFNFKIQEPKDSGIKYKTQNIKELKKRELISSIKANNRYKSNNLCNKLVDIFTCRSRSKNN